MDVGEPNVTGEDCVVGAMQQPSGCVSDVVDFQSELVIQLHMWSYLALVTRCLLTAGLEWPKPDSPVASGGCCRPSTEGGALLAGGAL